MNGRSDVPDTPPREASAAHLAQLKKAPDLRTRVALSRSEAAASLGCSVDFFEEHVQGELRLVRRGRLVLVPVKELEAWVSRNAARTVEL